jgi:hypothetical protein
MTTPNPIVPCRLCGEPAAHIWYLPRGCVCAPDPVQALCHQHGVKAEDLAGKWIIVPNINALSERLPQ